MMSVVIIIAMMAAITTENRSGIRDNGKNDDMLDESNDVYANDPCNTNDDICIYDEYNMINNATIMVCSFL
jgi:hypothetical protein